MKQMLYAAGTALCGLIAATTAANAEAKVADNLRIVIGSKSTGGDTYQNSAIIAEALSQKLGINAKVDAVGASAAFGLLKRISDGSVVMIFHDQSYLGHLYGQKGYDNPFSDFKIGPTVAINPGDAFVAPKKSPYNSLEELMEAAGKGTRVRVAIQPGGVSEIGYTAMKNAVKLKYPGQEGNLAAVNTGSQADKNQLLFDGQADLIHGSVQANEQYTRLPADDQKAMKFMWLPAREKTLEQANPEGLGQTSREELLKFASPAVVVPKDEKSNFNFDKEFFFLYNKDMDPAIVAQIDQALTEIFAEGKVQETQKKSFFIPNFKPSAEAESYLKDKAAQIEDIIAAIK
ncbi:MAG: ABC transporter substrate-binding protein [Alphaproteobacteria bacterium]|nr:ABC transporter substrate-binding protein [Alphaproteobacteria bacterium]